MGRRIKSRSGTDVGRRVRGAMGALLVVVSLAACAVVANAPAAGAIGAASATPGAGELEASTEWIVGTFALEDTGDAVSAEQAAALLPLWKAQRLLSQGDSAAPAEEQALLAQVSETMTAAQAAAIDAMELTRQDLVTLMEEQGLSAQVASTGAVSASDGGANAAMAGAPAMGMEGIPAGGEMPPMAGEPSVRTATLGNGGATPGDALVDAVIALLEAKI